MTQVNNSSKSTSEIFHNSDSETFTYNGLVVKIVTVFNDKAGSIALVEDESGEVFEVARDALK